MLVSRSIFSFLKFLLDLFVEENNADQQKLLQTIHEDKATLSRAMAQNKQLKDQLTELQDGFIKIVKNFDGKCSFLILNMF